jgi:PAS domain S-box-containing protein
MTSFRKRLGFGAYTALAFSLLSILLTLILVQVIGDLITTRLKARLGSELAELAQQTTDKLDRGMFERYREVRLLAQRFDAEGAGSAEARRRTLDAMQETYPHYAWIGMTDNGGKVLVSSKGLLEGADVSKRPWFVNAYKGRNLGDVHEAVLLAKLLPSVDNEPTRFVDVAFPYHDAGGKVAGILGTHLSWRWAREVQQSVLAPAAKRHTVEGFVVAADGAVLLGTPEAQGSKLKLDSLTLARAGASGSTIETWPDGRQYLVGYSKEQGYGDFPGLGWTVLVRQEVGNAYAPVRAIQSRVLWIGLIVAGVFSLIGLGAARLITQPIWALAQSAQRIEGGAPGEIETPRKAYFEVRALSGAINSLIRMLRREENALRELNATLEKRVEQRTAELETALAAVRRNEQRVATIIETAQDAFIGVDLNGRITDWNSQAERLLGWRAGEAIGASMNALIVPERFHASLDKALAVFRQSEQAPFANQRLERIVRTRAGEELVIEMTIGVIASEQGRFFGAFLHDISERKRVERMKAEFVSTVSHELRTPLTAICGSLGLLSNGAAGALPPTAQSLLEIANKSSERLGRLVNDILDIETIAAGTMEFDLREQSLLALLRQAIESTQGYAAPLGVTLELAADSVDARVSVDADRITQVALNLLSNAAKFSPSGGTVTVRSVLADERVRVSVIDRGEGMPESFRSRIFGRFAQVDSSDSRRKGGTGLGLAICKSIVEQHGGAIDYRSTVGAGSEFFFELPLAEAPVTT